MNIFAKRLAALVAVVLFADGLHGQAQQPQSRNESASEFRGLGTAQSEALQRRIERTILEQGVVESASVLELHSRVRGEATLVSAVPSGSVVKQGDLLVAVDDSALRRELLQQGIDVKQAEAGMETARAAVESAKRRGEADVPAAELALKVARLALSRYLDEEGEFHAELAAAERRIALARQRLKAAERLVAADSTASGEQSANQRPGDALDLAIVEAQAQLDDALAARQLLTRHVRPHQTAVLELGVLQAELALHQVKHTVAAVQRAAEAELQTAQARLQSAQQRLEELDQQIRHCRIHAPQDGIVLHAAPTGRRSTPSGLDPGATVREGQLLLTMPDLDRLRVRVGVHESSITRVQAGQDVTLRLDALPTHPVRGKVAEISRTPEPTQWFSPSVEYAVLVDVSSPSPRMKLGMTAAAEIQVEPRDGGPGE